MRIRYSAIIFGLLLLVSFLIMFYPTTHPAADPATLNFGSIAWMITASGLVMLMTPGLSFFYGGMVSVKNVISTMLQSFIALGVISVLWYVVGFSLAFGDDLGGWGIIGDPRTFFLFDNVGTAMHAKVGSTIPLLLFAAFQLKFAIITPALITGSFAERVRFWGYNLFICLWSLLVYCPLAHWAWHPDGFLWAWGVLDFAGGTVVHISAGIAALVGAMIFGRRETHGKNGHAFTMVNIPYIILGTGLLWFGWFGFNGGSALDANGIAIIAFFNTNLASAAAMIAWVLLDTVLGKKPGALGACIAAVVGLVAITPAAGFVEPQHALLIGVVAAIASNLAIRYKSKTSLDDTLDVFPCHGIGGIVGMLLTGVFASHLVNPALAADGSADGLFYGQWTTFLAHLKGLAVVIGYVFVMSWVCYKITALLTPLRLRREQESIGLDKTQHDETMVKEGDMVMS